MNHFLMVYQLLKKVHKEKQKKNKKKGKKRWIIKDQLNWTLSWESAQEYSNVQVRNLEIFIGGK